MLVKSRTSKCIRCLARFCSNKVLERVSRMCFGKGTALSRAVHIAFVKIEPAFNHSAPNFSTAIVQN